MRVLRMVLLVAVALAMVSCFSVQCAAGHEVSQVQDIDPVVEMVAVLVAGAMFIAGLCALGSGGLGSGGG